MPHNYKHTQRWACTGDAQKKKALPAKYPKFLPRFETYMLSNCHICEVTHSNLQHQKLLNIL